ncbi:Beta-secretase 2 [Willisornis vidua]|uniref:Beta-secretase 2 n=1 Tax=Willisornis vidua TaxID=1566151 RepID=A0ABQ9D3R6_9PASS|nr:Beta-secretase 2 [Willisornis vidua]
MGTPLAAPGFLLLLAGTTGLCRAFFSLPLRVSRPAAPAGSPPAPVVLRPRGGSGQQDPAEGTDGLALASDPGGTLNFLAMVENLQGDSGRGYYLEMLIGTPPQALNILVDTGSSNFAVAGVPDPDVTSYFNPELSSTYRSQGIDVTVKYSQGSWTGVLGTDVITMPKGIYGSYTINIATILESENFFLPGVKWHGILGLAYDALAKVLGGIEPSLYTGDIWYTPIKEEWYYQVEILKLEVGGQNLQLDCREVFAIVFLLYKILHLNSSYQLERGADRDDMQVWEASCQKEKEQLCYGYETVESALQLLQCATCLPFLSPPQYNADKAIVDSGTTLLRLPEKVFGAVVQAIARTSLLYIQPILGIGENLQCYRFGISSSTNALVIGATVMEGFYVIFDRAQRRVGFAVSPCAEADGSPVSEIEGPFTTADVASNCVSSVSFHEPMLWIASYALMSLCGVILLVLIILLLIPPRCQHSYTDNDVVNDESSLVRHRWKCAANTVHGNCDVAEKVEQSCWNVFINDMGSGIEGTLSEFADDTKLSGVVDSPEGWDGIQRDLDKLRKWVHGKLLKFSMAKCKVLHMGQGNP